MTYMQRTAGGYNLSEVISALQKSIRRGEEYNAMYWSLELIPKFEKYLWRRLLVIINEDIGIANPTVLLLYPVQRATFFQMRAEGRDGPARLILANLILAACRGPKSRLADHFQCVVSQDRIQGHPLKIPDYAYDKHTSRGRGLKRGIEHFRLHASLLVPASILDDEYEERAYKYWAGNFQATDWGKRSAKDSKPKQGSFL